MKWVLGLLLALNIMVFALAKFSSEAPPDTTSAAKLPDNTASINLHDPVAQQLPLNCFNTGPIAQQIVVEQFEKTLLAAGLSYRVIAEPARKASSYRVAVSLEQADNVEDLRQRLNRIGVGDTYEKTLTEGKRVLSVGVFTYKKTAAELTQNLRKAGFAANFTHEYLSFPKRFWINLDQSLEPGVFARLTDYAGKGAIGQHAAKCHG